MTRILLQEISYLFVGKKLLIFRGEYYGVKCVITFKWQILF
jgi:hypothetical protein